MPPPPPIYSSSLSTPFNFYKIQIDEKLDDWVTAMATGVSAGEVLMIFCISDARFDSTSESLSPFFFLRSSPLIYFVENFFQVQYTRLTLGEVTRDGVVEKRGCQEVTLLFGGYSHFHPNPHGCPHYSPPAAIHSPIVRLSFDFHNQLINMLISSLF